MGRGELRAQPDLSCFSDVSPRNKEFYENDQNIVIEETERDQSINLFGCKNVVVQVRGKVNAVNMSKFCCKYTEPLVEI